MKKALRITCYNEGTQNVTLVSQAKKNNTITIRRSNIKHTLELLHRSSQLQLFENIIISNDGSTDDTIQCIQDFIKQYQYANFVILDDKQNRGKGVRFAEAMERCISNKTDIFVSADADVLHPGDTIPSLTNILSRDLRHMRHVISPYYETNVIEELLRPGENGQYIGQSGIRGTHVQTRRDAYIKNKEIIDSLFGQGNYTLEPVLEHVFKGKKLSIYKENKEYTMAPILLQPFRKGKSSHEVQNRQCDLVYDYFTKHTLV